MVWGHQMDLAADWMQKEGSQNKILVADTVESGNT